MITITLSSEFKEICPNFAGAGIEAAVCNSPTSPLLWAEIERCCADLQTCCTADTLKLRPGIAATRAAYKRAGKDPSRYRPACEQLARRVLQGKGLYSVDTLVDLVNLASLFSGYATAALDADHIAGGALTLGIGQAGEPYEGIGRGVLNIEHLPVYRDILGGVASPTSDSVRTKVSLFTSHLLVLINGYDGDADMLRRTVELTQGLLRKYAGSDGGTVHYY